MKSVDFLYAALVATGLIHGTYMIMLYRRYRRLETQLKELGFRASAIGRRQSPAE